MAAGVAPTLDLQDRLTGTLLGTALGDALGLATEGLSPARIRRHFGSVDEFRLFGRTGFVSDDTEQAALVAQSLARHPDDADRCAADFRRALVGWFLRLPWGIGRATLISCLRSAVGLRPSGVRSAGNGAAMRAAVMGVFFRDEPELRERFGRALAEVTHLDARAVAGALFVAELAAGCASAAPGVSPLELFDAARATVAEPSLAAALAVARDLAEHGASVADAAQRLGTTGFVLHTVPFAAFCLLRSGSNPASAISESISAGGDTDSIAAILGAWLGARYGETGLPQELIDRIHDGPFGPTHLRALGSCLAAIRTGEGPPVPAYSPAAALARNLALYPVVLYHGFRRLLP
jgi:ADP-ribosyl-[dinitrogen reductase] hydrolase